jgi:hypothetical protein
MGVSQFKKNPAMELPFNVPQFQVPPHIMFNIGNLK